MKLARLWSERKKILLLGLLAVLLLILWGRQADLIPPGPAGRVVRQVFYPVEVSVAAIDRAVSRAWLIAVESVRRARNLEAENRALKTELALLRARHQQLIEDYEGLKRLSHLAADQPGFDRFPHVIARIIGIRASFLTRTVTIDRGRADGVAPGMPVVNQDGLVGVVREVTDADALVQLLVDREFGAGVLVSETRDRGVVMGTGELSYLRLRLENPQTHLETGYTVKTSGLPAGSLFPKGFVVGTVESVERDRFGLPYGLVRPVVRFERLEEVVVLLQNRRTERIPQQLPVPPL